MHDTQYVRKKLSKIMVEYITKHSFLKSTFVEIAYNLNLNM